MGGRSTRRVPGSGLEIRVLGRIGRCRTTPGSETRPCRMHLICSGPHVKRFYITTAIDYPNNTPHLGTAYEKVTADVIARYKRMAGLQVHFLMGNDEHSTKVAKRAEEQGLTPIQWCDRMEAAFK